MQQRSFTKQSNSRSRRQRTRNQRKRIHDAVLAVAMVVFWLAIGAYSLKVWATHPAEQPVTYQQHMASIQGGDC
jgi:hypothetical protein